MSEQLSGRELDRAIAEALGRDLTYFPEYHASVDALREVEPDDINVCWDYAGNYEACIYEWPKQGQGKDAPKVFTGYAPT